MDVLAVLHEMRHTVPGLLAIDPIVRENPVAKKADEAIAAVADLIAADVAFDLARGALEEYYRQVAEKGYAVARLFDARALTEAMVRADDRRAMALLNVAPLRRADGEAVPA